jgi:hypothetical protein
MIKLRSILLEQPQEAKKLNVLFITDYPTDTVNNYAKSLIATGEITGEVKSYSREDSLEAVSLVAYNISTKIDLLVVQVSGVRDKSGKTLYNNLSKISEIAERKRVPVVFIATPTTDFSNSVKDYDYIDQAYNLLAKRNEVIEMPELNDDSYFSGNGLSLNKAGERIVYSKLASYLKTLDAELDLTPIEEKEPEEADVATLVPTSKQNTIGPNGQVPGDTIAAATSIAALPAISQGDISWQRIMAFLVDKGLTVAGAAGIAGNMKIESEFNPTAVGDKGTSYGLVQWHAERKDRLFAYAKSKGQHPGDVNLQLDYLWNTLTSSYYKKLLNHLKTTDNPRDAAYKFAEIYEVPAVISNKRLDYAEQYAKEYDPSIIDRLADLGAKGWSSLGALAAGVVGAGAVATSNVKLSSSDTYGFPQGKVDSGKVVAGGEGGNWGGSMGRALAFAKVAKGFMGKDIITSQKRSRVKTASGATSDHYQGSTDTYAVDLGVTGKKGDELLAHLMQWFGHPEYKGGSWLNINKNGYRYQIGWRVADHYDHIHVGVKKL